MIIVIKTGPDEKDELEVEMFAEDPKDRGLDRSAVRPPGYYRPEFVMAIESRELELSIKHEACLLLTLPQVKQLHAVLDAFLKERS